MKKLLFAAGITVLGLSAAFAQEVKQASPANTQKNATMMRERGSQQKNNPEAAAEKRTERLEKELALNADQKKKVYDLFLKEAQDRKGRMVQNSEMDTQLKAIFNEEQNKKYEAMKAERKQMMQERLQTTRSSELKSPTPVK